jgi:5-methylcytosine-specific restriction endonuclease McrA
MKDGAIARSTRRKVFERDNEQCTFVDSARNKRCPAKEHLEIDHIIPRSKGGKGIEQNLRLRCRTHNRLAAEQVFGRAFIDAKINERRSRM